MKQTFKKLITLMLATVIMISAMPASVSAATTGPSDGYCFIKIEKSETEATSIFFPKGEEEWGEDIGTVAGFSYNKKTNTLTIKNVKKPKWVLNVNEMGTDFKIKVEGKNELLGLTVWGFGYGGSVEFTGSGTLTLNKSQKRTDAIIINAEASKSVLKVGKKVNLNAYAGKETKRSVLILSDTIKETAKAVIFSNGTSTKKIKKIKSPVPVQEDIAITEQFASGDYFTYAMLATICTKKGSSQKYGVLQDWDNNWMVYKITNKESEIPGINATEYVETVADYEAAGYKPKTNGYVYDYVISGNLTLKAK